MKDLGNTEAETEKKLIIKSEENLRKRFEHDK